MKIKLKKWYCIKTFLYFRSRFILDNKVQSFIIFTPGSCLSVSFSGRYFKGQWNQAIKTVALILGYSGRWVQSPTERDSISKKRLSSVCLLQRPAKQFSCFGKTSHLFDSNICKQR